MSLKTLINDYTSVRNQFMKDAQTALKAHFKEFFDANPKITGITWTQYTPYFMDGDTCVFGMNEVYFTNLPEEYHDNLFDYTEYGGEELPPDTFCDEAGESITPESLRKACEEFNNDLSSDAMLDVLKETFGDHVQVTATRKGFNVTDHEHD